MTYCYKAILSQKGEYPLANYQPVSKTQHQHLKWKRYSNYLFARYDPVAEISLEEIERATLYYPQAFVRAGDGYRYAVILGLEPKQNLYVDRAGAWTVDYVPASYRAHPFKLFEDTNGQQLVCVDMDSGLVQASEGENFFDDTGEASAVLKQVVDFLASAQKGFVSVRTLCNQMNALGLIEPWPLKIQFQSGERTISDLYRVSPERFAQLGPDDLASLRDSGALKLIYAQQISIQNIYALGKLLEKSWTEHKQMSDSTDLQFLNDQAGLSFDKL
ncbi:peptidase [Gammaproteobacteria bacterium LSUCC0112]|nr:peptidase [Gammaproteobacteria bacterium LSUCC0112]